jgi:hypothetical protein
MIGVGLRAGHIEKIGMSRASFPLNVQNLACSVDSIHRPLTPAVTYEVTSMSICALGSGSKLPLTGMQGSKHEKA